VPSPEYYHRQADLCLRMALSASDYEERLRLLDIANGYRDDAVRVEALQGRKSRTLTNRYLPISIYEYIPRSVINSLVASLW
jgi:hypothetical protein